MDFTQEYWWQISLRLKLRQTSGDAFQNFFSDMMNWCFGNDFVRVRPYGQKGDKGCDGYLQSTGMLYQCYGALNGDKSKVDYLTSKMEEDFQKAKKNLPDIMKGWSMVHNLIDGLPVEALQVLEQLKKDHPEISFAFFGLEKFDECIKELKDEKINEILGPAATNTDCQNLQIDELRKVVESLIVTSESTEILNENIEPVPVDKLDANKLPINWQRIIKGGWQNAPIVSSFFQGHHDPLLGENIAKLLNERYKYLKSQKLESGAIMDGLYEFVAGIGTVTSSRQVVAQAILAYFFESCDIFEKAENENDITE